MGKKRNIRLAKTMLVFLVFCSVLVPHHLFGVKNFYSNPHTLSGGKYLWSDKTNWSTSPSTYTVPTSAPGNGDDIYIVSPHLMTLDVDFINQTPKNGFNYLQVDQGATIDYIGTGSIFMGAGSPFQISGSVTVYCTELKQNATTTISTTGILNTTFCNTINSGATLTVNGTLNIAGTFTVSGTINGTGVLSIASGTTIAGTGGTVFGTPITNVQSGQTLGGFTWRGATSTDWTIGSNWQSSSAPSLSSDFVSIAKTGSFDPHISTTRSCGKIIVNSGNILNIDNGGSLTASDSITNKGTITINPGGTLTANTGMNSSGTININSNSSGTGSLMHNTNNLNATIYRYITGNSLLSSKYYHLVSVPITSASNPTSNLFLGSYLFEFDVTGNSWTPLGTSTITPLTVTKGYMVFYPGANHTYSFTGALNNGSFSPDMTYAASGYNLVPNPYPSAIDWDAATGWTKTNVGTSVWIFNAAAGNYGAYVYNTGGTGTNGCTRYIPVGQAFFVQATSASPILTMTNPVRVNNTTQSFLRNPLVVSNTLKIKADANSYMDEALVLFRDGSSPEYDSYDAEKFFGRSEAPQIYLGTPGNFKLSVSSLPSSSNEVTIPLGFELDANLQATLSFSEFESFSSGATISLQDLMTGAVQNIREYPVYTFSHNTTDEPSRFILHFNGMLGGKENEKKQINIYSYKHKIILSGPEISGKDAIIEVCDIIGKPVFSSHIILDALNKIEIEQETGIYVVRVISGKDIYVKKIIL